MSNLTIINSEEFKKGNKKRILDFIKRNKSDILEVLRFYILSDTNRYICPFFYHHASCSFFEVAASELVYFLYIEITDSEEIKDYSDYGIFGICSENKEKRQKFCQDAINYLNNLK